jgi:hypothetical protein
MRLTRNVVTALALVSSSAWLGCNALVGIDEGELATSQDSGHAQIDGAGSDGKGPEGASADGPTTDAAGETGSDATIADSASSDGSDSGAPDSTVSDTGSVDTGTTDASGDTGSDGTVSDGGTETSTGAEAGPDATVDSGPTFTTFSCGVDNGTLTLVDDLSTLPNGASLSFQRGIWIAPTSQGSTIYVLTQRSDENADFRAYAVGLTTGVVNLYTYSGLNPTGSNLRLLDVTTTQVSTTYTTLVLTSYGNGALAGLQVAQLPEQFGGPLTTAYPVGSLGAIDPGTVGAGRMAPMTSGATAWLASTDESTSYSLVMGAGTQAAGQIGSQTLGSSPTNNFNFSAQATLFDIGGDLYTVQSLPGTSQDTVYAVPDSLGDAGVQTPVAVPDAGGALFEAKISATDPTKVLLLGVTLSTSGTGAQLYVAKVPPSQLESIDIGPPQFTPASTVSLGEFPTDNSGRAWSNDDFVTVGSPGTGGSGMAMALVDGNGNLLNGALIENDGNQIQIGAVQFINTFNEVIGGSLYIAWIEYASVDGSAIKYSRIYAARVTCVPSPDGG